MKLKEKLGRDHFDSQVIMPFNGISPRDFTSNAFIAGFEKAIKMAAYASRIHTPECSQSHGGHLSSRCDCTSQTIEDKIRKLGEEEV